MPDTPLEQTLQNQSDYIFVDGPMLGRERECAIVQSAMRTPGSLVVLSGKRGMGKQAIIGNAQLDQDEHTQKWFHHPIVHIKGDIGGVGDSLRSYFQRRGLPTPVIPSAASFARHLEELLAQENVVVVVSNVTVAELLTDRVPIVRGRARTIVTTCDPGLASVLLAQGHRDVQHLEIGPLADADLAALDERPPEERWEEMPSLTADLIHWSLLADGYPWTICVLRRILEPDVEGNVIRGHGLRQRLVEVAGKLDADGLPMTAHVAAQFAAAQMSPLARRILAWWLVSGTPLADWRRSGEDEQHADGLIEGWGLSEGADLDLHPAVAAVVRTWPEYRAALAAAPAMVLLKFLERAERLQEPFMLTESQQFHFALAALVERAHFDVAARILRVLWPGYARLGLYEWLVDWSARILPHLAPGRDTAALRAWLGKAHLALHRPDLALVHLRRAIPELQQLPEETLESARFHPPTRVRRDGLVRVVVAPTDLGDTEFQDALFWGHFTQTEWPLQQADATLDFESDHADRFLPNHDLLTLARVDYALALCELGEAERAWREIVPILPDIRQVLLHEWRAQALEIAGRIAAAADAAESAIALAEEAAVARGYLEPAPAESAPEALPEPVEVDLA